MYGVYSCLSQGALVEMIEAPVMQHTVSQHVRSGSDHSDFEVGHHDGWAGSISQLDTGIFDDVQQFLILRLGLPSHQRVHARHIRRG